MVSIGELFVSLGFDVDDEKLKDFSKSLKDVNETMIKLGGSAVAALGSLTLFMQSASNHAVGLSNMATQWGVISQNAQTFANALHGINPSISINSALDKYKDFSNFINAAITQGKGGEGAGALARLGVRWSEALTPEEARKEMAENKNLILKTLSNDPTKAQAIYSDLLKSIPGLADTSNLMSESEDKYQSYAKYDLSDSNVSKLTEYARATAELDDAWTKLYNDLSANIAPDISKVVHILVDTLNYADKLNAEHPLLAEGATIGGVGLGGTGLAWWLKRLIFGGGGEKAGTYAASEGFSLNSALGMGATGATSFAASVMTILAGLGVALYPGSMNEPEFTAGGGSGRQTRGLRNNNPGNIKYGPFAASNGATGQDSEGFAIFPDMGMGTSAIGKLLNNYAAHGNDTINSIVGRYTHGDSAATQFAYASSLSKATGYGINDHLNLSDPSTLQQLISGIIKQENGLKSAGNVVNVYSNSADPLQVGKVVIQHLDALNARRNVQTNPSSGY